MLAQLRAAVVALLALTLLTGVAYPIVVTVVARAAFAKQAGGSLIHDNGRVRGSVLLGQPFEEPKYFWGRLSATSPFPYNAGASAGSNFGPSNTALIDAARARIEALRAADPGNVAPVPVDLVTSSASGLDPHVSPASAAYQSARVARVRGLDAARVQSLVAAHTENADLGFLGEPRVNVLALNMALDRLQ